MSSFGLGLLLGQLMICAVVVIVCATHVYLERVERGLKVYPDTKQVFFVVLSASIGALIALLIR